MNKILPIVILALILYSCDKSEPIDLIPTTNIALDAGEDIILQDQFCVELHAASLPQGQTGVWSIKNGLIDEHVYVEQKNSAITKFHGLPGEQYLLVWTVTENDHSAEDSILVKFKPLTINIQSDSNENYSTRKRIWVDSPLKGRWTMEGDIHNYRSTQLGGTVIPKENSPSIIVNGKENGKYKAIWTVTYGSVSFSDTIIVNTGEYTEYEALEDLQLLNRPYKYKVENNHITEMYLSGEGIGWIFMRPDIYPSLKALKYLRHLDLAGDGIGSFSDSIAVFYKELEYLRLNNNYITSLPENIGLLKKLETLILYFNDIERLPDGIGGLESLKTLTLDGSPITEFPESFGNLEALEVLDINDLNLKQLPNSFGNLKSLKYLHIGSVSDKLPDSFCNLVNLTDLYITQWNRFILNSLPENFGNLKSLKRFELDGYNKIKKLPASFCELDSLEELKLSTELEELPNNFWNLKQIQSMRLVHTNLKTLPNVTNNESPLKTLSIEFTQDVSSDNFNLPNDISKLFNLIYLEINNRKMDSIPSDIGKLSNLKHLYLRDCGLNTVPDSIGNLSKLQILDLTSNNLTILPTTFKNLTSLQKLYLRYNYDLEWQINEIKSWFEYTKVYF